jgi:hypothetical protein
MLEFGVINGAHSKSPLTILPGYSSRDLDLAFSQTAGLE